MKPSPARATGPNCANCAPMRAHAVAHSRGVTLIEALIAIAVLLVLLGAALPHFGKALERRHLEGAAAQLATDIKLTRSLAVAHNTGLRMSFSSGPGGSCYVVHDGAANACSCQLPGPAQCTGSAMAQRSVFFAADGPVQLQANVPSILFHPMHGTSTPAGTLRVLARSGAAVHQVVNIMGRARACSPNGVPGYVVC